MSSILFISIFLECYSICFCDVVPCVYAKLLILFARVQLSLFFSDLFFNFVFERLICILRFFEISVGKILTLQNNFKHILKDSVGYLLLASEEWIMSSTKFGSQFACNVCILRIYTRAILFLSG